MVLSKPSPVPENVRLAEPALRSTIPLSAPFENEPTPVAVHDPPASTVSVPEFVHTASAVLVVSCVATLIEPAFVTVSA